MPMRLITKFAWTLILLHLTCVPSIAQLKELQPLPDTQSAPKPMTLEGRASLQDPDRDDKAVLVEWDKWHNRIAKAAYQRFNASLLGDDAINFSGIPIKLGMSPMHHFPDGLKTSTTCLVTADHHIMNLRVVKSSGVKEFDNLVLRAVKGLDGKSVLKFPKNSQRLVVTESDNFWVGTNTGFHQNQLGDVEKLHPETNASN